MRTNLNFRDKNEKNDNLQRDDKINVWGSAIKGWENINISPLTIGIRGGITRQFWGEIDWDHILTWESIPGHALGPSNRKIK